MEILKVLGIFGGIFYFINSTIVIIQSIHKAVKDYYMELGAKQVMEDDETKNDRVIGFKTREEELEEKLKNIAHELRTIKANKRA